MASDWVHETEKRLPQNYLFSSPRTQWSSWFGLKSLYKCWLYAGSLYLMGLSRVLRSRRVTLVLWGSMRVGIRFPTSSVSLYFHLDSGYWNISWRFWLQHLLLRDCYCWNEASIVVFSRKAPASLKLWKLRPHLKVDHRAHSPWFSTVTKVCAGIEYRDWEDCCYWWLCHEWDGEGSIHEVFCASAHWQLRVAG